LSVLRTSIGALLTENGGEGGEGGEFGCLLRAWLAKYAQYLRKVAESL